MNNTINNPLASLQKYFEENGAQKTEGYLDALQDFTKQIDGIMHYPNGDNTWFSNSPNVVKTKLKLLFTENINVLKEGASLSPDFKNKSWTTDNLSQ